MRVLDLFSAAAGGWSLGMHRAGFTTIAACELIEWRRILYAQNNPGVRIYENVRSLTASRLVSDLGCLPDVIVGSPPCQDISSANTKGEGVDGARSGLFFDAVRLIGECRPRWFALENSANLRTRGADRVLGALEDLGYAGWPLVVRARDLGANHERPRCWIVGCDPDQVAGDPIVGLHGWPGAFDAGGALADAGNEPQWRAEQSGPEGQGGYLPCDGATPGNRERPDGAGAVSRRHGRLAVRNAPDANKAERRSHPDGRGDRDGQAGEWRESADRPAECASLRELDADADETRLPIRQGERCDLGSTAGSTAERDAAPCSHDVASAYADDERQSAGALDAEMGGRPGTGGDAVEPWADWNGGLAGHLRMDDGLSAWLAGARVAVGAGRGTAAASLIVEAFGDAVIPQIPEAIGAAIWRVEAAMAAVRVAA